MFLSNDEIITAEKFVFTSFDSLEDPVDSAVFNSRWTSSPHTFQGCTMCELELELELKLDLELQLQLKLDVKLNTPTHSLTATRSQTQIFKKKNSVNWCPFEATVGCYPNLHKELLNIYSIKNPRRLWISISEMLFVLKMVKVGNMQVLSSFEWSNSLKDHQQSSSSWLTDGGCALWENAVDCQPTVDRLTVGQQLTDWWSTVGQLSVCQSTVGHLSVSCSSQLR